ncbi:hypothetical protein D3H65_09405 [Paraflavitalea soli]|uniref:Uncharacterized protein n=2 Tax=Paraflavitalea soli TaxID=2315862 RepID=A0A3B7MKJ9_9BACT|nr:hypothetical protein D3H65_09405 [Paraflavitalea soli]
MIKIISVTDLSPLFNSGGRVRCEVSGMKNRIKIRQLQYENEAAQRLLEFLLQENVILKTRLAEALQETVFSADQMNTVEQYQEWLLQKDDVIGIMRQEAASLEKLLIKYMHDEGTMKMILHKQKKLRKDLKLLAIAFSDLRVKFNGFIETLY